MSNVIGQLTRCSRGGKHAKVLNTTCMVRGRDTTCTAMTVLTFGPHGEKLRLEGDRAMYAYKYALRTKNQPQGTRAPQKVKEVSVGMLASAH